MVKPEPLILPFECPDLFLIEYNFLFHNQSVLLHMVNEIQEFLNLCLWDLKIITFLS